MDIITLIKSRNMTVSAVAKSAGLSRVAVYDLRNPNHQPNMATLLALAKAIGCKPSDIRPELARKGSDT